MYIDISMSWWAVTFFAFVIFVVPVKFAGDFVEVRRVGFIPAACSLVAGAIATMLLLELQDMLVAAHYLSLGNEEYTLLNIFLTILAFLFSFKWILCTTFSSSIGVLIISLFLWLVLTTAFCSFEIHRTGVSGYELANILKGTIKLYIN